MPDIEFEEEEFTTQVNRKTVMRIIGLATVHWQWVLGFLVAIAVTSILDAYFTYLGKRIVDEGIIPGDRQILVQIFIQYGLLILVQSCSVFAFVFLAGVLGKRIRYDLRKQSFNHIQDLSLSYFNQTPVGWLMSRVTSDTERVADLVTWGLLDSTWAIMNIVTASVFMLIINWKLALIVLVAFPILVVIAVQFRKKILNEFRISRKMNSRITAAYNENITGVRIVKALGRESANLDEFSPIASEMYRSSYRAAWLSALFLPTVQIIAAVALASIILLGGYQAQVGAMTAGGIMAFVSYVTFMMWPVQDLARIYAELQHAIASAERIFNLQDSTPEIADLPAAFDPGTLRGDIEFENVAFHYDPDKPVITGFNLHVKQGEMIALVGPTGGGKTTIVNLLCRFFEPKSGSIRLNGHEYREYTLHAIQSRIGIVLQTPHLFSGTIRENIRYGRLNASDEEIEAAAQLAGAHEFIVKFTKGYEENVGEGGSLLSVGQKQLISLARAVLAQPEIFIMDEATSSVDTLTESLIQQGMEHLMQGRTTFIIAHRLSTIKRADRIIVLENGKITEIGTHAELLQQRGHYYRLYTQQFRSEMEQDAHLFRAAGLAA